ncbi:MAG: beta-mannanase [Actinobacteria bacterium]|nr:beta-mannanase [Actinomycetota bacterium]
MRNLRDSRQEDKRLTQQRPQNHETSNSGSNRVSRLSHTRLRRRRRALTTGGALIAIAAIALGIVFYNNSAGKYEPLPVNLPPSSASYLGIYAQGVPHSYSQVTAFTNATGANPDIIMYYSGWFMPFPAGFATTVADHGAAPLVQLDPDNVRDAAIASGQYDGYLSSYAEAVRAYMHPVILSFGHEMNGSWSPWGYTHQSPAAFVAAWRHVVNVFRALGARNVTWLWTVNIINNSRDAKIDTLDQWWPGSSYVNWVGIDGYYLKPSWRFAPLFGPTIRAVRALTTDPILIAETGAVPAAGQPAKITDLFAGIRSYGLLGFVWFDSTNTIQQRFTIDSPAADAAFRKGASTYRRPGS